MRIVLNGVDREVPEVTTVASLIADTAGSGRGSAVVINGVVVPRSRWSSETVAADAEVELITAVQGG